MVGLSSMMDSMCTGPPPKPLKVGQRVAGVIELQFDPLVLVLQVQLAPILIVSVHNIYERASMIGQPVEQLLFDLGKFAGNDFVVV